MKSRDGAIRDTVRNKAAVPEYLYGKLLTSLLGGIMYFHMLWFLFFFAFFFFFFFFFAVVGVKGSFICVGTHKDI